MHYKFPQETVSTSAGSLSSMIDIVFLLIIFFVVTASFDQEQIDSGISLPTIDTAAIKSLPPERLMLNVLVDGSVKVAFYHIPASEVGDKLSGIMQTLKANRKTVLIINGDRDTPHKFISAVLNTAAKAGYNQVRINAEVRAKDK